MFNMLGRAKCEGCEHCEIVATMADGEVVTLSVDFPEDLDSAEDSIYAGIGIELFAKGSPTSRANSLQRFRGLLEGDEQDLIEG